MIINLGIKKQKMYKQIFLIFILIYSCKSKREVVITNHNKSENAISYKLKYKRKNLMGTDTINYNYDIVTSKNNCNYFIKSKNSSSIFVNDSLYIFYTKTNEYIVTKKDKYFSYVNPVCKPFKEILRDSSFVTIINDTIKIKKDFSNNKGSYEYLYYIKNDKIIYIQKKIYYLGFYQFEEFFFDNFNKKNINFEKELITKKASFKKFERKIIDQDEKLNHLLSFTGEYLNGKKFTSKTFEQENVLYFFWHSKCLPCIMSFPKLNKLSEKYKGRVTFIAVNLINDKQAVEKVLEKHNLFILNVLANKFETKINYYPYFVLLKKNEIKYSSSGYSDKQFIELDSIIKTL